jgi:hypothetical protein
MSHAVVNLLSEFERLGEAERSEVAAEILRRVLDVETPMLRDEELLMLADQVFLELEEREAADGAAATR